MNKNELQKAEESLDCHNAIFTNDNMTRLECKITNDHCQYQFYCSILDHAVNKYTSSICGNFKRNNR